MNGFIIPNSFKHKSVLHKNETRRKHQETLTQDSDDDFGLIDGFWL